MDKKFAMPEDPSYQDQRGDAFGYGRHKSKEQLREVEWMEKLRNKKIAPKRPDSTMLTEDARKNKHDPYKPVRYRFLPNDNKIRQFLSGNKSYENRFKNFDDATKCINTIVGANVPLNRYKLSSGIYVISMSIFNKEFSDSMKLLQVRLRYEKEEYVVVAWFDKDNNS